GRAGTEGGLRGDGRDVAARRAAVGRGPGSGGGPGIVPRIAVVAGRASGPGAVGSGPGGFGRTLAGPVPGRLRVRPRVVRAGAAGGGGPRPRAPGDPPAGVP